MERLAQCSVLAIILVHFLIYALSSPDGFLFVPSTHTFFSVFVFVFLLLVFPTCTQHTHTCIFADFVSISSLYGFLFVPSTHIFLFLFLYFFSWWRIPICTEHTHFLFLFFIFKCFLVSCKGWAWLFGEIGLDVNNSVCRVSALLGMCKVHNLFSFAINSLWCYLYTFWNIFWLKSIYIYMCI